MNRIFCPECGAENHFVNGGRPNFCSSCGYDLKSLKSYSSQKIADSKSSEEDEDGPPQLNENDAWSGIKIEINKQKKIKAGDIAFANSGGSVFRRASKASSTENDSEFLKNFQKEVKSINTIEID